jgi:uncharacterized coiled-coil protein SlyX
MCKQLFPHRTAAIPEGLPRAKTPLLGLTTGTYNTAVGLYSLLSNTDGKFNTGVGAGTLLVNTSAERNTATGAGALFSHATGNGNTANGAFALFSDTSGQTNTATGASSLFSNISGSFNTANGFTALFSNTGNDNTAIGAGALQNNIIGGENTAVGVSALASNTIGNNNVAIGYFAGIQQTTGSDNIYIGFNMQGTAGESNACYIGSIFGQTSSGGIPVLINGNHKLGTTTSSKRFKEDIKPMGKTSEALFSLEPVAFRYKKEIDPNGVSQFGLVAEEVEKVNPDLIVRDKEGKPYSVRYDQVNAMLLNEFLKEHRKMQEQGVTIAELKSTVAQQQQDFQAIIAKQQKQIQTLSAGLEKVSSQVEMSSPAARIANNNH